MVVGYDVINLFFRDMAAENTIGTPIEYEWLIPIILFKVIKKLLFLFSVDMLILGVILWLLGS